MIYTMVITVDADTDPRSALYAGTLLEETGILAVRCKAEGESRFDAAPEGVLCRHWA